MQTLTLFEAAIFLQINPRTLRQLAYTQQIPGRKVDKGWLFIDEHLADWVSGRYAEPRRLTVIEGVKTQCQFTKEMKHGGSDSQIPVADEYASLLGLATSKPHKNTMTKEKRNVGDPQN